MLILRSAPVERDRLHRLTDDRQRGSDRIAEAQPKLAPVDGEGSIFRGPLVVEDPASVGIAPVDPRDPTLRIPLEIAVVDALFGPMLDRLQPLLVPEDLSPPRSRGVERVDRGDAP